jgi:hypothetical protein
MLRGLGCLGGVFLIGFAVVLLLSLLLYPVIANDDNTTVVAQIHQAVFCRDGETIAYETYSRSYGAGRTESSTQYFCEDVEGFQRDVTGIVMTVGIVGFTLALLMGILLSIMSVAAGQRKAVAVLMEQRKASFQRYGGSSLGDGTTVGFDDDDKGLDERLAELQRAYEQRLITREEYDKLRAEILHNFSS